MPDYAGPLQRLVFSRTLWLIVVWPLVGCLWQIAVARPRIERAVEDALRRREIAAARNAGIGCLALATVSTLAHAAVLARTPVTARALFEHVAAGARVGCLDAEIDLWFDPLSATFCSLACLVALAASAVIATHPTALVSRLDLGAPRAAHVPPPLPARAQPRIDGWRTWAWLHLSLSGALIAFLSDGFIGTAMGWTLAGGASVWLAAWDVSGSPSPRAMATSAAIAQGMRTSLALWSLLAGAAVLFWGLGGSWDGEDYVADLQPRFVPVHAAGSGETGPSAAGGSVTLTSAPGALVFLDDARTPALRSPAANVPVAPGLHTIRVRQTDAASDEVLGQVSFSGGEEIALVPFGPTLAFRAIAGQLGVRAPDGDTFARRGIESRSGPWGAAVAAASVVAFLLAAWAMSGGAPPAASPRALSAVASTATTAMLGPYLLARLAFLFPLTVDTWAVVESIGAATLLVAAWHAPSFHGLRRWLAFLGVAPAALTWLALGAAGVSAATYVAIVVSLSTAALYLAASVVPMRLTAEPASHGTVVRLLFVRLPYQLGQWLEGMERWVIGALTGGVGNLGRAGAWTMAALDEKVVAASGNAVAARLVRVEHGVEPVVGAPVGRIAWALVGAACLAALVSVIWRVR